MRRFPLKVAPGRPEKVSTVLGNLRLTQEDLDELLQLARRSCRTVRLFAGKGVAPRGVADLDDAESHELSNIRIETKRPDVVIYLGRNAAEIVYDKKSSAARRLANEVELQCRELRTWMPPVRTMIAITFFIVSWVVSMTLINQINESDGPASRGLVVYGSFVAVALSVSHVFPIVLTLRTRRKLRERGSAVLVKRFRFHTQNLLLLEVTFPLAAPWLVAFAFLLATGRLW